MATLNTSASNCSNYVYQGLPRKGLTGQATSILSTAPQDTLSIRSSEKGLVKDNSFNHPDLEMRVKPNGERGVFAKGPIKKGEITTIFAGDFVTKEELSKLPKELQQQSLQMSDNIFQVASTDPEHFQEHLDLAEYYNHSCDPNTFLVGNNVLIAAQDIKPGEELTFDYGTSDGPNNPDRGWKCDCGSPSCRQQTSPTDYQTLAQKYGPEHLAEYLKRRYEKEQTTSPFALP